MEHVILIFEVKHRASFEAEFELVPSLLTFGGCFLYDIDRMFAKSDVATFNTFSSSKPPVRCTHVDFVVKMVLCAEITPSENHPEYIPTPGIGFESSINVYDGRIRTVR